MVDRNEKVTVENMIAWHHILLANANDVVYRIGSQTAPTRNFYNDLAESLEALAKRVRREIKDEA